jgi:hypothetical protein
MRGARYVRLITWTLQSGSEHVSFLYLFTILVRNSLIKSTEYVVANVWYGISV